MKFKVFFISMFIMFLTSFNVSVSASTDYNSYIPSDATKYNIEVDSDYIYVMYYYPSLETQVIEKSDAYTLVYKKNNNAITTTVTYSAAEEISASVSSTVSVGTGAKIEYCGIGIESEIELSSTVTYSKSYSLNAAYSFDICNTDPNGYYFANEVKTYATIYLDKYKKATGSKVSSTTYKNMIIGYKLELGYSKTEPALSKLVKPTC